MNITGGEEVEIRISIIGGDKREKVVINELAARGYHLRVLSDTDLDIDNVYCNHELKKIVKKTDIVIAPMSGTDENGNLKSKFIEKNIKLNEYFFNLLEKDTLFLIGIARPKIKKILVDKNIDFVEMAYKDELAILNAIPTAEGAIKIAIEETEFTIYNSKVITFGLGRVGLTLAWRLNLLGAESYAVTRNKAAIARGKDLGLKMISYQQLPEYIAQMDIIFNTVPSLIIHENLIYQMKNNCVIIDLASAPGGTDFKAAAANDIKAILASGLPGKVAPLTAGKMLNDVILDLINK
ncbi:MAG: dipicolinate synthase subunit DpsA [Halanaerobiaceae bacterium]